MLNSFYRTEETLACQFCKKVSQADAWGDDRQICPACGKSYQRPIRLVACPITLRAANHLVSTLHRHHQPIRGWKFGIGAKVDGRLVGAVLVGRPVCREFDADLVAEVTRLVTDGTRNACSFLYSAAARCCREMGYVKIQTYILADEDGTSLLAAGWGYEADTTGGTWESSKRYRQQGRRDDQPQGPKQRWAKWFKHGIEVMKRKTEVDTLVDIVDIHPTSSYTPTMHTKPKTTTTAVSTHIPYVPPRRPAPKPTLVPPTGLGPSPKLNEALTRLSSPRRPLPPVNGRSTPPRSPIADKPSKADSFPLVSVLPRADMDRVIEIMKDDSTFADEIDGLTAARKAMKAELVDIATRNEVPGLRWGSFTAYIRGMKVKRTFSTSKAKVKLVELGLPAEELEDFYSESEPFPDVRIVDSTKPKKQKAHDEDDED